MEEQNEGFLNEIDPVMKNSDGEIYIFDAITITAWS